MNTNLPHALAPGDFAESDDEQQVSAETVRVTLIYLAWSVAAVLMAAACISHWSVYFV